MANEISITGRRILLVEDNFSIANAMALALEMQGAEIIGPAANVKNALALIADAERIDGAALDINLNGETAYPIIDVLRSRGVPLVIITGYDARTIKPGYGDLPLLQKPMTIERLIQTLFG